MSFPKQQRRYECMKVRLLFFVGLLTSVVAFLLPALCNEGAQAQKMTSAKQAAFTFKKDVLPFVTQHCFSCHGNGKKKGGVTLDKFTDENAIQKDRALWETALEMVRKGEMPPKGQPRPSKTDTEAALK